MKLHLSIIFPAFGILCLAAVTIPGSVRAQAPAGPLPAAQPQSRTAFDSEPAKSAARGDANIHSWPMEAEPGR